MTSPHLVTVLLVDDEESIRRLTRRMLERVGYHVLDAASGEDALACADAAGDIHVLLTDVSMPGMSGHELAARLAAAAPRLRVIFMSGYAPDDAFAGFVPCSWLTKPFSMDQLLDAVRSAVSAAA